MQDCRLRLTEEVRWFTRRADGITIFEEMRNTEEAA
jgi:hypothetical protein